MRGGLSAALVAYPHAVLLVGDMPGGELDTAHVALNAAATVRAVFLACFTGHLVALPARPRAPCT